MKKMFLFNTLGRVREEFNPLDNESVRMYTCGPTVYNFAHIGNFRAYIFEDILRRTLKYCGYNVVQVMNLTDVDDKTIRDSKAAGLPLKDFTSKYKAAFFDDLKTLGIEKAERYPAATEHIPEMIELIKSLEEKGFAYKAEDGSIYYRIAKFPDYGKLARIDMENQKAGVRIKNDEYAKDSVADFALWKAWDEADGDVAWDSPWGRGRPGWHIECSGMSMKSLGKSFVIHTGGSDNMFPHHEDEIAQSEAANGCKYVNYWLHCEHLIVNGEKMSKSLGNFFTLRDLLNKGYDGAAIRWVLIGTHYRKKLNFTFDELDQAKSALRRFKDFFARLKALPESSAAVCLELESALAQASESFGEALCDDLNISGAFASVYNILNSANKLMDEGKLGLKDAEAVLTAFRDFDRIFGVFNVDAASCVDEVPADIIALAEQRQAARKAKDFKLSDSIRDNLKSMGWVIEDTSSGTRVKRI